MSTRLRAIPFRRFVFAFIFFGLVNYLAARQNATSEERWPHCERRSRFFDSANGEGDRNRHGWASPATAVSMMDTRGGGDRGRREARVIGRDGIASVDLLRERRNSFVELNS